MILGHRGRAVSGDGAFPAATNNRVMQMGVWNYYLIIRPAAMDSSRNKLPAEECERIARMAPTGARVVIDPQER